MFLIHTCTCIPVGIMMKSNPPNFLTSKLQRIVTDFHNSFTGAVGSKSATGKNARRAPPPPGARNTDHPQRRLSTALPPAAHLPLQPVAGCELTNKHTNKHDGSQYLLTEVITWSLKTPSRCKRQSPPRCLKIHF